jgi:hypothetical protein
MTTRRDFIKKSALSAALLSMSASMPSLMGASSKNSVPKRFIFIRKGNGMLTSTLELPSFSNKDKQHEKNKDAFEVDLDKHELPSWMNELNPYKNNLSILQGLSMKMCDPGHAHNASPLGVFRFADNVDKISRASVDVELGKLFPSPFSHIELSLGSPSGTGIAPGSSSLGPKAKNYCYADAQTAYNEMFKVVTNPKKTVSENVMIEHLLESESQKLKMLKGNERRKISDNILSLSAIIKRNKKLLTMSDNINRNLPTISKVHAGGGLNASITEKQDAMTDILIAGLKLGLTNSVTYCIDSLHTDYKTGLPGFERFSVNIHKVGHGQGIGGRTALQVRNAVLSTHAKQIAKIIDALKKTPEGNGNMFDNTMIFYFPEGGSTHHGTGMEEPFVVLSGDNCKLDMSRRYTRLPYHLAEGHQTLGNWWTTVLNAYGNPIKHFGDLDMEMASNKINQLGPIKQFMRL